MFKPWQLLAIRKACGWSQGQLAKRAGVTAPTISALEDKTREKSVRPNIETVNAIVAAFENEGWFFTPNGIEQRTTNTYMIEGDDCYLKLLHQIESVLKSGDEILKSGANERRSSPEVIKKIQSMRDKGLKSRSLIQQDDDYIMGDLKEYRSMDNKLYTQGDIKVIFSDRVAYLVTWTDIPRVIIVQDKIIADDARKTFNFIWDQSTKPNKTTAVVRFNDV